MTSEAQRGARPVTFGAKPARDNDGPTARSSLWCKKNSSTLLFESTHTIGGPKWPTITAKISVKIRLVPAHRNPVGSIAARPARALARRSNLIVIAATRSAAGTFSPLTGSCLDIRNPPTRLVVPSRRKPGQLVGWFRKYHQRSWWVSHVQPRQRIYSAR